MTANPERVKYERMWRDHPEYRVVAPGEILADEFVSLAKPKPHHTVIDFGCGTGRGALRIARRTGASVMCLDFAPECLDEEVGAAVESGELLFRQADLTEPLMLPRPADFGYCTDVLEHIQPEHAEAVLANVVTSARRVYLCISTVEDRMGALIGEPLHLTVQPAEWWQDLLETKLQCKIYKSRVMPHAVVFYLTAFMQFNEIEHRAVLNVEEERIRANIRGNLELDLVEVVPHVVQPDMEVSLLCGGPSLADFAGKISGPVVTVNGAYHWAIENGLRPGLQIVVDAREFNARFVSPLLLECKYAISSQCDPSLAGSLPKHQVLLWHGAGELVQQFIGEWDAERNQMREYFPVPGGTTVALRALPMLAMLGFRKINVYGLDSCVRGPVHHAYSQPENDADGLMPIVVDGREFRCAGWMVQQAQEFQEVCRHILIPAGVELAVHGDGLIAAIINAAAAAGKE